MIVNAENDYVTAKKKRKKKNAAQTWANDIAKPTKPQEQQSYNEILGISDYTGDPEDVAKQKIMGDKQEQSINYVARSGAGGVTDYVRDTANDIGYRAQSRLTDNLEENDYWADVGNGGENARAWQKDFLSSLTPNERDALEITGQLGDAEANYYAARRKAWEEELAGKTPVQASHLGEKFNAETEQLAEDWELSDGTRFLGNAARNIGYETIPVLTSVAGGKLSADLGALGDAFVDKGMALSAASADKAAKYAKAAQKYLPVVGRAHAASGRAIQSSLEQGADFDEALKYGTWTAGGELALDLLTGANSDKLKSELNVDKIKNRVLGSIQENEALRKRLTRAVNSIGTSVESYLSDVIDWAANKATVDLDDRSFGEMSKDEIASFASNLALNYLEQSLDAHYSDSDYREKAAKNIEAGIDDVNELAGSIDERVKRSRWENASPQSGDYDPKTGFTEYNDGGRRIYGNMDDVSGIGVLDDGTIISGGKADPVEQGLCNVVMAENYGKISPHEADRQIYSLAVEKARNEHPYDLYAQQQAAESYYREYSSYSKKDFEITDATGKKDDLRHGIFDLFSEEELQTNTPDERAAAVFQYAKDYADKNLGRMNIYNSRLYGKEELTNKFILDSARQLGCWKEVKKYFLPGN